MAKKAKTRKKAREGAASKQKQAQGLAGASQDGLLPGDVAEAVENVQGLLRYLPEPGERTEVSTNLGKVTVDKEPSLGTAELALRWFDEVKMRQQDETRRSITIKLGRLAMHVDRLLDSEAPSWPSLSGKGEPYANFKARIESAKGFSEVDYLRIAGQCFNLLLSGEEGKG